MIVDRKKPCCNSPSLSAYQRRRQYRGFADFGIVQSAVMDPVEQEELLYATGYGSPDASISDEDTKIACWRAAIRHVGPDGKGRFQTGGHCDWKIRSWLLSQGFSMNPITDSMPMAPITYQTRYYSYQTNMRPTRTHQDAEEYEAEVAALIAKQEANARAAAEAQAKIDAQKKAQEEKQAAEAAAAAEKARLADLAATFAQSVYRTMDLYKKRIEIVARAKLDANMKYEWVRQLQPQWETAGRPSPVQAGQTLVQAFLENLEGGHEDIPVVAPAKSNTVPLLGGGALALWFLLK